MFPSFILKRSHTNVRPSIDCRCPMAVIPESDHFNLLAFLLTHSKEFQIAMAFAFTEYFIEWFFFPWLKTNWIIILPAFGLGLVGQIIRTISMYTAGVSFHHYVQVCSLSIFSAKSLLIFWPDIWQDEKADNHTLVSSGVYAYVSSITS